LEFLYINTSSITAYRECNLLWEFQCNDKRCIQKEAFCDNHYDCDDNSDEPATCTSTMKHNNKCPVDRFDCKDGTCIFNRWKCDGDMDCPSGDDEKNCTGMFNPSALPLTSKSSGVRQSKIIKYAKCIRVQSNLIG
jgi:hypothetical protein